MTPAQAKAVMEAAPANLLRAVTVHDVTGLDGDQVAVTATLAGVGTFSVVVPLLFGPLPLTRAQLIATVVMFQSRLGAVAANFETDVGRGFNVGRGGLPVALAGYGGESGWV